MPQCAHIASTKTGSAGYCEAMVRMKVCSAQIGAVVNFSLRWGNFSLRHLSNLTRTLSMPNEKCYMNFKYALHKYIMIVLRFDGTSSMWVQSRQYILVMLDNTKKGSIKAYCTKFFFLIMSVFKRSTLGHLWINCSGICLYT